MAAEAPAQTPVPAATPPAEPVKAPEPTTLEFSPEQLARVEAIIKEERDAAVKELQSTKDKEVSSLKKRLSATESAAKLDPDKLDTYTERMSIAQEHAEMLGEKFGLTEKQVARLATLPTRAERLEWAEDFRPQTPAPKPTETPAEPPKPDANAELRDRLSGRKREFPSLANGSRNGGMPNPKSYQELLKVNVNKLAKEGQKAMDDYSIELRAAAKREGVPGVS